MAIATKIKTNTQTHSSFLPEDFKNQIANNMSSVNEPEEKIETPATENIQPETSTKSEAKGKYNDVANLHFSRGKKAEFKAFFSANEVTLVQGVENAVNYIMKEVKAGRLKVSRNGIEKVEE